MLAYVKTLAPLEINLISSLANLLAQFYGYLGQVVPPGSSQKEVPYLMLMPKTKSPSCEGLLAQKWRAQVLFSFGMHKD